MDASDAAVALSRVAQEVPTPDEILKAGLIYVGFDRNRQAINNLTRKNDWFKAFYGVKPTTVAPLFGEMKTINANITCKKCLLTMNWLYLYDTYPVLSARWNCSEEFIGRTLMQYGMLMASVGRSKIVFDLEHDVMLGRTVDCSTFMVQEMRLEPSAKWFDFKTNSCGLVSSISMLNGLSSHCRSDKILPLASSHQMALCRNMSSHLQHANQGLFLSVVHIHHQSMISRSFVAEILLIKQIGIKMRFTSKLEWEKNLWVIVVTLVNQAKLWWKKKSILKA